MRVLCGVVGFVLFVVLDECTSFDGILWGAWCLLGFELDLIVGTL